LLAACQPAPTATPTAQELVVGHYLVTSSSFVDLLPDGSFFSQQGSGTYRLEGDKITFVNEGNTICGDTPGVYQWSFEGSELTLTPVDDACPLRMNTFKALPLKRLEVDAPYVTFLWKTPVTDPDFNPNGLALDSAGNIYVSNGDLPQIQKYDPQSNFLASWQFNAIQDSSTYGTGVATGKDGNIYPASFLDARIEKFAPDGTFLSSCQTQDGHPGPLGMGTDAQGNLCVALHRIYDHYVEKHDPDGKLVATWGIQGSGDGQVGAGPRSGPELIGVDAAGNNYISDFVNNRVVAFDQDGNHRFDITGDGNPDWAGPRDVAVDGLGHVFVVGDNPFIWEYDSNGKYLGRWLAPGIGPVAVASDGNIVTQIPWGLAKMQLTRP